MIVGVVTCPDCGEKTARDIKIDAAGNPVWSCKRCGVVHEDRSWYQMIDQKKASEIIETREPRGRFVLYEGIEVVGIDNETGDAWTEEFPDMMECLSWLCGEKEMGWG